MLIKRIHINNPTAVRKDIGLLKVDMFVFVHKLIF